MTIYLCCAGMMVGGKWLGERGNFRQGLLDSQRYVRARVQNALLKANRSKNEHTASLKVSLPWYAVFSLHDSQRYARARACAWLHARKPFLGCI